MADGASGPAGDARAAGGVGSRRLTPGAMCDLTWFQDPRRRPDGSIVIADRLVDGTGAPPMDRPAIEVVDGRIAAVIARGRDWAAPAPAGRSWTGPA